MHSNCNLGLSFVAVRIECVHKMQKGRGNRTQNSVFDLFRYGTNEMNRRTKLKKNFFIQDVPLLLPDLVIGVTTYSGLGNNYGTPRIFKNF